MKQRRILKSVAKRNKKKLLKHELREMRKNVMKNNITFSGEKLEEYRVAKERLRKIWYTQLVENS